MLMILLLRKHYNKATQLRRLTDRYGLCCSQSIVTDLNCWEDWHLLASDLQLCMRLSEPALMYAAPCSETNTYHDRYVCVTKNKFMKWYNGISY